MVALIVSDWFYDEVVRHHLAAGPSYFRQVRVVMKETEMTAWVRVLEGGEVLTRGDTGQTGSPELAQQEAAPPPRPGSAGEPPGSGRESAEPQLRRRLAWRVRSGTAVLVVSLAACCYVLGYWGIGNGFAHGPGWGALSVLVTLSMLVTVSVVILVVRRRHSRPSRIRYLRSLRYRAAMACCVAAAGLLAGATRGSTNLVPPCAAPTELAVLTSQEDLAAVQAALPGFEQNEPARLHTA